jgi:hypothetical protein
VLDFRPGLSLPDDDRSTQERPLAGIAGEAGAGQGVSPDHRLAQVCCGVLTSQADVDQRLRWSSGGAGLTHILILVVLFLARRAVVQQPRDVGRA